MAVKHRCPFCRKYTRPDKTCQNPDCILYVPEPEEPTNETPKTKESEDEQ